MTDQTRTKRYSLVGAGAGLGLFAVVGLLPGAFMGGVVGLRIASMLYGGPVEPLLMVRFITVFAMVMGVMLAGLIFITAGATFGWIAGLLMDHMRAPKSVVPPAEHKNTL